MVISGSIDEIRFRNDENGYSVVSLDCDGDPVICAGNFPPIAEGQTLRLSGDFIMHPKFGKQFKVKEALSTAPNTLDGIVRYLGSGLIKGVGAKTALAIVDTFGEKTLDIIENNPSMLAKIRGISKAKAAEISSAYKDIRQMQDAMVFLQGNNISLNMALKIYKQYGLNTVAKVNSNPYRLIEDIDGVGFITADKIANSVGIKSDSAFRIRAGLLYTLRESGEKNGNTFLPRDELITEAVKLLGLQSELVDDILDDLIIERKVKPIELDDIAGIMLIPTYRVEKSAGLGLIKLIDEADTITRDCSEEIAEFERSENIHFHEQQKQAIDLAINNGVTVITGGPGTGKTTIIKCILSIFNALNFKTALMAPTGRAAKRLSESTNSEASTIHRALMIGREGGNMSDCEPLAVNVVIVDEFSMVDIFLFDALLRRLPQSTKLIIVGDADQLPSVGAGNVLKDIMASGLVSTAKLTQIYRQANESQIITNAHAINNGVMPDLKRNDGDFFFSRGKSAEDIAEITVSMAAERIPNYLGIEPYRVQVLCPMKNGYAGANNLNIALQQRLNGAEKIQIKTEDCIFRKGDKVMHIANNYSLEWKKIGYVYETGEGVFNGDMGVISEIRLESGEIDVIFDDLRQVTYTPDIRSQLIPAYAITVHKSQGSEFDAVIVPIATQNPVIMTRNLLYTAITRAKKMVVLVGDEYNIKRMIDNNYIAKRYSALKKFICESRENMTALYKVTDLYKYSDDEE